MHGPTEQSNMVWCTVSVADTQVQGVCSFLFSLIGVMDVIAEYFKVYKIKTIGTHLPSWHFLSLPLSWALK